MSEPEYWYVWMIRERGRRKGDPPGPWRPNGIGAVSNTRDHFERCVEEYNARPGCVEHAVFRVPFAAMVQVYPAPPADAVSADESAEGGITAIARATARRVWERIEQSEGLDTLDLAAIEVIIAQAIREARTSPRPKPRPEIKPPPPPENVTHRGGFF